MTVIIAGGGMAAGMAAATLRDEGYDGSVVILGSEANPPFGRPPLSKTYLRGKEELSGWFVRPAAWYEENDVELRTDDPVTAVDPSRRLVITASGEDLSWDQLLIATGVRNRALRLPGAELEG